MKKTKRRRRNRGARKQRRRPRQGQPVQIVTAPDGGPFKGDCTCPVCVDMARSGVPLMTIDAEGNLVEVERPTPPPMIDVVVRGNASTWPELSTDPQTVSVPAGCIVQDLLEYLRYRNDRLQRAFPPCGLSATIAGEPCEDDRVVCAGDELRVSGQRDPEWTSLLAELPTPT